MPAANLELKSLLTKLGELLIPPAASLLLRTVEITIVNDAVIDKLRKEHGGFICVFWHNRMIPLIWAKRNQGIAAMVSPSRDGRLVASILKKFGYHPVEGSSNKKPVAGARSALRLLKEGRIVAIIPDGPRGPIYSVSPGAIILSQLSQKPILPATCLFSNWWELNSWDRLMIPKPFSKVVIGFGDPIIIPKNARVEEEQLNLKKALFALERRLQEGLKLNQP